MPEWDAPFHEFGARQNLLNTTSFVPETALWDKKIDALHDLTFGANRTQRAIYRLRDGVAPLKELSFIAHDTHDTLYASLRFWPVCLPDNTQALLFGPLSVHPSLAGKGVGKTLITTALAKAQKFGKGGVVISGHPKYYNRFGFTNNCVAGLKMPGDISPFQLMGIEWIPETLSQQKGILKPYRKPYRF